MFFMSYDRSIRLSEEVVVEERAVKVVGTKKYSTSSSNKTETPYCSLMWTCLNGFDVAW